MTNWVPVIEKMGTLFLCCPNIHCVPFKLVTWEAVRLWIPQIQCVVGHTQTNQPTNRRADKMVNGANRTVCVAVPVNIWTHPAHQQPKSDQQRRTICSTSGRNKSGQPVKSEGQSIANIAMDYNTDCGQKAFKSKPGLGFMKGREKERPSYFQSGSFNDIHFCVQSIRRLLCIGFIPALDSGQVKCCLLMADAE